MSQAFYRKWRPAQWDEVVGQEHVVQTLQNAVRSGHVGHAYLFAGPRGTGKTTTARLLAKAVNCTAENPAERPCNQCENCQAVNNGRFLDLIEIDAASNTSVDDVRDLRDKINFSPSQGKFKVYIIDEVHMLSTAAFNALLKTLEEPPAHAIFILATTEVHKIPATVLSRCQHYEFRRIPVPEIVSRLNHLAEEEKIKVEPEALTLIARQSTGSLRDAISLLDQLAGSGDSVTLANAQMVLGTAANQTVIDLVNALLHQQSAAGLEAIHQALDSGSDARQLARQIVEYLRSLLLISLGNENQVDVTEDTKKGMKVHAQRFAIPQLLQVVRLFNDAASEVRSSWQPSLLLELAFSESLNALQPAALQPPLQNAAVPQNQSTVPVAAPASSSPPAADPTPVKVETTASAARPEPISQPAAREVQTAGATPPPVNVEAAASISIQPIMQKWNQIREMVKKQSKPTEALLNSCSYRTIKDGVLLLGFQSDVVKSKMDIKENIEMVRSAIHSLTGMVIPVQCIVVEKGSSGVPADLDLDEDGLVRTALNLGGRIVKKE
jgi:DNA polymerase-3 subunit gamma/tau